MKKREILELYQGLQSLKDLSGVKFAYAISKNLAVLEKEVKSLEESVEPTKEFGEFEKNRIELAVKYSQKDENSQPKIENIGGVGQYVIEDRKTFDRELETLRKKNKSVLNVREKQYEEYKDLLETDSKVELHKIKLDDVPKEITVGQMDIIKNLIE